MPPKSRSRKDSSRRIPTGAKPKPRAQTKTMPFSNSKPEEKQNILTKRILPTRTSQTSPRSTTSSSTRSNLTSSSDNSSSSETDDDTRDKYYPIRPVIECRVKGRNKSNPARTPYTVTANSGHAIPEAKPKKRDRTVVRTRPKPCVVSRTKCPLVRTQGGKSRAKRRVRFGNDGRRVRAENVLTYTADCDKTSIMDNFDRLGFRNVLPEESWHVYWASVQTARAVFSPEVGYRLNDNQLFNHFPNHYELSRKDLLVKNIKRYRRDLEKAENPLAARDEQGNYLYLDIIPTTFNLPHDYSLFLETYRRNPTCTWIMKPSGRSQGSGIFLVNRLARLKKWCKENEPPISSVLSRDAYVISRYIDDPFLIGGKKFDLRLYVLVTSFRPLKAYQFTEGFCRFCSVKYNASTAEMDNVLVHLTNVAIQRTGGEYNGSHGGKLTVENLRLYVEGTRGRYEARQLFDRISWLIVHSLKAVSSRMSSDRHCFELYGYDIIVDACLRPWLVEVNSSPSLASTTARDRVMKAGLIGSVLGAVLPPGGVPDTRWDKCPTDEAMGKFRLLIDEEAAERERERQAPSRNRSSRNSCGKHVTNSACTDSSYANGSHNSGANSTRTNTGRFTCTDSSGANATGANSYGANTYAANSSGAYLTGANSYGANSYGANSYGANSSGANSNGANSRHRTTLDWARAEGLPRRSNF